MANLTRNLIILAGLLVVFNMAGVISDDSTSKFLAIVKDPSNLFSDYLSINIGDVLRIIMTLGSAAGGVYLAVFYFKDPSLLIMAGVLPLVIQWGFAVYDIYNQFGIVPGSLTALLVSPFIISTFIDIVDWWRSPLA